MLKASAFFAGLAVLALLAAIEYTLRSIAAAVFVPPSSVLRFAGHLVGAD